MTTDIPEWKYTHELLRSQGKSDEDIEQGLKEVDARFNGTIRTKDFAYYVLAMHVFKIPVPRVSSFEERRSQEPKKVKAADITYAMAKSAGQQEFSIEGWVLDPGSFTTKQGKQAWRTTLVDASGQVGLRSFNDAAKRMMEEFPREKFPAYWKLDRVQAWTLGQDGVITVGVYADITPVEKAPMSLHSVMPDAMSKYVSDKQMAGVKGFVTDERRQGYEACANCHKSMKSSTRCPNCGGIETVRAEFHRLTVTDGGSRLTVVLPPALAPGRELYGHPIEVVARYEAKSQEFMALSATIDGEAKFVKPREVFSAPQVGVLPKTVDILNRYVRVFRKGPKEAVLKALQDAGQSTEEAEDQVARALKQGLILEEGPYLVWAEKQKPAVLEAPRQAPPPYDKNVARGLLLALKKMEPGYKDGVPFDILAKEVQLDLEYAEKIISALLSEGLVTEPVLFRLRSV